MPESPCSFHCIPKQSVTCHSQLRATCSQAPRWSHRGLARRGGLCRGRGRRFLPARCGCCAQVFKLNSVLNKSFSFKSVLDQLEALPLLALGIINGGNLRSNPQANGGNLRLMGEICGRIHRQNRVLTIALTSKWGYIFNSPLTAKLPQYETA